MATITQLKANYIKAHRVFERVSNARYLAELALENSSISAKALRKFRDSVWFGAPDKAVKHESELAAKVAKPSGKRKAAKVGRKVY